MRRALAERGPSRHGGSRYMRRSTGWGERSRLSSGPAGTRESLVRGGGCGGGRAGAAAAGAGAGPGVRGAARTEGSLRLRAAAGALRAPGRAHPGDAPGAGPSDRSGAEGAAGPAGEDALPARGPSTGPRGGCGGAAAEPHPRAGTAPGETGRLLRRRKAGACQHYREPARLLALGCKGVLSNP